MPKRSDEQFSLFNESPVDYRRDLHPGKTAMRRRQASPIARQLVQSGLLARLKVQTILDYGCGIGEDVRFYQEQGYRAVGFDAHPQFGFSERPKGEFDLVTCLFVMNVIASADERASIGARLVEHTKAGGLLIVATRSPRAIAAEAEKKKWIEFQDGYLSSPTRGTFQRGISEDELRSIVGNRALDSIKHPIKTSGDVCLGVFTRLA